MENHFVDPPYGEVFGFFAFLLFYSSDHPEIKLHGATRWDGSRRAEMACRGRHKQRGKKEKKKRSKERQGIGEKKMGSLVSLCWGNTSTAGGRFSGAFEAG